MDTKTVHLIPSFKDNLSKVAKLIFEQENNTSTLTEKNTLENSLFDKIAMIIELYNLIVPYYAQNHSDIGTIKSEPDKQKVNLKKLDYTKFIKSLQFNTSTENRYYASIIKNLLIIIVKFHDTYKVIILILTHFKYFFFKKEI